MPNLLIKDVPDDLYQKLREAALRQKADERGKKTIKAYVLALLRRHLGLERGKSAA